jgi:acyl-coenzyme A synthetase/AMP-(fatty) acid ligase
MTQAGGKLDNATIAFFSEAMRERGGGFWTMYGQTEATARISILPACELPAKLGSAGRAIPGGRLSILADSGECTTAAGVEGELVYDGPNVMMGYALERADLAKGDELGGRLHTGDRAVLDDDGCVRILGRVKRDAKVFGLRMNLDEIEAFIRPKGPAAAVAGGKGVVVFCEFGDPAQYAALGDELSARLKVHRSAFEFRHIERLPTRDTGKIAYETLQERL